MSVLESLFNNLYRLVSPLRRITIEPNDEISIEMNQFYRKVINEVFVLIGTCSLEYQPLVGLKDLWTRNIQKTKNNGEVYSHRNLHSTKHYQNTKIGITLLDALSELSLQEPISPELRAKILALFDIGIIQVFKKNYEENTVFDAHILNHNFASGIHIFTCKDFVMSSNEKYYQAQEVKMYIYGGKSSAIFIDEDDQMAGALPRHKGDVKFVAGSSSSDQGIKEKSGDYPSSPHFIVCQFRQFRKLGWASDPAFDIIITHGIIHFGAVEAVFSGARGRLVK